jgi:hypothetical protein
MLVAVLSAAIALAVAIGARIDWADTPPLEAPAASRAPVATGDGDVSPAAGAKPKVAQKKKDGAEKDSKGKPHAASSPGIAATPQTGPGSKKSRPGAAKSTPTSR